MTVESDAEKLDINSAERLNQRIITGGFGVSVGIGTIRQMYIFFLDIDFVKKVLMHKIRIALVVFRRQSAVFVEIYGFNLLKAESVFFKSFD